jgi:hypothetical protein
MILEQALTKEDQPPRAKEYQAGARGSADLCLEPRQVRHAHRFSDIARADFSFLPKYVIFDQAPS